ncbi:ParB/RepB/Spo0J family partition protein [Sphingomonas sp. CFBP8993]|uniref:ParB/RepB/Spo0J family partition protein n=1 Tax=Sphingomonas sp. CFBP8993 TaxID=3096526 RepID=UPI002A6B0A94|nr:ParB/RepB/Spo0J family partition protein [Sphingomonas sp. CFBP8993]MDY0960290.1 ParB/RepB/Spo0J family partition protein [Sphingomonas sp. CFBP8993]
MARKQSDYLADLLAEEGEGAIPANERPAPEARSRGTTLLGRESALARVASGEVRQVTQLLLDPARVKIWPGNARHYDLLSEDQCRELIDSIIAEGGQKVPAVVRRIEGDPDHDFEVIAGTRRHWSISWLRANSYPDMAFVAQVAQLDDEAAFRLADLENRARADVSDLERARNYLSALRTHYGNHQTRMAERLKLSKGWLSKMLKVGALPDAVIAAFASPHEVQLKSGYALAQAMQDEAEAHAITGMAKEIACEQAERREHGKPAIPAANVVRRLLGARKMMMGEDGGAEPYRYANGHGRDVLSIQAINRHGVTVRLHADATDTEGYVDALRHMLAHLEATGQGLKR